MYAVRRNLRKGEKFGWLQVHEAVGRGGIKKGSKDVFVNPAKHSLKMTNCYLHNSLARTSKIHLGMIHKERCAWIVCESFEIVKQESSTGDEISFNPRIAPHFMLKGENVDGEKFTKLTTLGAKIFKAKNS